MRPLFLMLLCLFALPTFAAERAIAWEGKGADGKTIRFDPAHRTKPAILLFWATWCPYCEALMPTLQTIYDEAGKDHLDVYAIDIKEDGDPVKTLQERKQTFTLILDGDADRGSVSRQGNAGAVPRRCSRRYRLSRRHQRSGESRRRAARAAEAARIEINGG